MDAQIKRGDMSIRFRYPPLLPVEKAAGVDRLMMI